MSKPHAGLECAIAVAVSHWCVPRCASRARRIRCTDARLMPVAAARRRIVHPPRSPPASTSCWIRAAASPVVMRAARPRPGASRSSPPSPHAEYRSRQMPAVRGLMSSARAMARFERPSAASSTMRARFTTRCGVVPARIHRSRCSRTSGATAMRRTPRPRRRSEARICGTPTNGSPPFTPLRRAPGTELQTFVCSPNDAVIDAGESFNTQACATSA
jgi:hypothetical protein